MKQAPMYFMGKRFVLEEVFKSPFVRWTPESAMEILNEIRSAHSEKLGWLELEAWIEKMPNGGYRAVRHHAFYR